jgi:hypothetical protein
MKTISLILEEATAAYKTHNDIAVGNQFAPEHPSGLGC